VISGTFERFIGASGEVNMIAPLPGFEYAVVPMMFVAETLAQTDVPHARL
jgi:hypothetical protein